MRLAADREFWDVLWLKPPVSRKEQPGVKSTKSAESLHRLRQSESVEARIHFTVDD